jgi:hypothetical protein
MLNRAECTKLVLLLERSDLNAAEASIMAHSLSEIVVARAEGRGLGKAVDSVLRKLLTEIDTLPKERIEDKF